MGADRLAALIEAQRPHLALWIPVLYALGIAALLRAARRAGRRWMLAALGGALARRARRRSSGPGRWRGCCSSRCSCRRSASAAAALRSADGGGAGAGPRDDGERRGAGRRARPLGQRPAAGAARPRGDPRARAGADAGAGADLARSGDARPSCCSRGCGCSGRRGCRRRRRRRSRAASTTAGVAWFERIGAVGYARTPLRRGRRAGRAAACGSSPSALRMAASAHIQAAGAGTGRRLRRGDPDRRPFGDPGGGQRGATT